MLGEGVWELEYTVVKVGFIEKVTLNSKWKRGEEQAKWLCEPGGRDSSCKGLGGTVPGAQEVRCGQEKQIKSAHTGSGFRSQERAECASAITVLPFSPLSRLLFAPPPPSPLPLSLLFASFPLPFSSSPFLFSFSSIFPLHSTSSSLLLILLPLPPPTQSTGD